MQNSSRLIIRAGSCVLVSVLLLTACAGKQQGGSSGSAAAQGSSSSGRFSFFGSVPSSAGGSMSSATPVVMDLSSSSMPAGTLSVMLTSDHSDVRPGDQVFFTVIVRNVSTVPAVQVKAVDSFSPAQLRVVASDGQAYLNHVDWLIRSIQPDQKVTLRLKMRVADSVAMDEVIHTSVVLMQGGVMQPSVGNADLHVTQALPQTGAEHTGPLEDTSRYLSPL